MNYIQTEIDGVWLIEPKVFRDERGYFMEAFKEEDFKAHIGDVHFVQDNESKSSFGVLRGLDLRRTSPTFGKYVSVELSEENQRQFFIPRGFAHGFLVLSDEAIFTYKVDNVYAPQAEASIRYNDEAIGIDWPVAEEHLLLSPKDKAAPLFKDAVYFE